MKRNKKPIKGYINYYMRLIRSGMHGAAGYVDVPEDKIDDLEIAIRFLRIKGYPVDMSTEFEDGRRRTEILIEKTI